MLYSLCIQVTPIKSDDLEIEFDDYTLYGLSFQKLRKLVEGINKRYTVLVSAESYFFGDELQQEIWDQACEDQDAADLFFGERLDFLLDLAIEEVGWLGQRGIFDADS